MGIDAPVGGHGVLGANGGEGKKHVVALSLTPILKDRASILANSAVSGLPGFERRKSSIRRKSSLVGLNSCWRAAIANWISLRLPKSSSLITSGRIVFEISSIRVSLT